MQQSPYSIPNNIVGIMGIFWILYVNTDKGEYQNCPKESLSTGSCSILTLVTLFHHTQSQWECLTLMKTVTKGCAIRNTMSALVSFFTPAGACLFRESGRRDDTSRPWAQNPFYKQSLSKDFLQIKLHMYVNQDKLGNWACSQTLLQVDNVQRHCTLRDSAYALYWRQAE